MEYSTDRVQPTADATAALTEAADVAGYAPSIHNTQPWRWRVDHRQLELYADAARQLAVTDPIGRLMTVSCGAALHHARVALAAHGWRIDVHRLPAPTHPELLARLSAVGHTPATHDAAAALRTIRKRRTDRRPVSDTPVPAADVDAIRRAVEAEGAWLHTLRHHDVLELATAADRAQTLEEFDPRWREELAYWASGDRTDGLGIPDAAIPRDPARTTVPGRDFGRTGSLAMPAGHDEAATYAILFGPDDDVRSWLRAGEALSAAWLTAVGRGVSLVPMSAAVEVDSTRQVLRRLIAHLGEPFLVLRLGIARPDDDASVHPPRLPSTQVIDEVGGRLGTRFGTSGPASADRRGHMLNMKSPRQGIDGGDLKGPNHHAPQDVRHHPHLGRGAAHRRAAGRRRPADVGLQLRQRQRARPARRPADLLPAAGSPALASPEIGPYLNQYAGQQLTTGAQAEAYADHFIAVHLKEVADGKTYAQVSTAGPGRPDQRPLQGQVNTLFKGETLRGMLLNAYAFWKLGQIALYAAIAAFVGAAVMLILTLLGFRPPAPGVARRGDPDRRDEEDGRRDRLTPLDAPTVSGPPNSPRRATALSTRRRPAGAADKGAADKGADKLGTRAHVSTPELGHSDGMTPPAERPPRGPAAPASGRRSAGSWFRLVSWPRHLSRRQRRRRRGRTGRASSSPTSSWSAARCPGQRHRQRTPGPLVRSHPQRRGPATTAAAVGWARWRRCSHGSWRSPRSLPSQRSRACAADHPGLATCGLIDRHASTKVDA